MKHVLLVLLLLLSSPVLAQQSHDYHRVDGTADFHRLLTEVDRVNVPGYALLVGTPDEVLMTHATGSRSMETGDGIDVDTPFYIASVGKTFTAWAILLLYEQGTLKLEDVVGKYVPDLPSATRDVTIFHLLNHTSGLPDYYDAPNADDILTNRDVLNFVRTTDSLDFRPGVDYSYSNTAYVLLAEIIETVTGQSYADHIVSTFLTPLGMNATTVIDESGDRPSDSATGYSLTNDETWQRNDYENRTITGPGGFYSTVGDLYLWYQAIQSDRFIRSRTRQLAMTPGYVLSGSPSYMAMGWFDETFGRHTPDVQGVRAIGAIGSLAGFRASVHILPDHDLVFIYLSNSSDFHVHASDMAAAYLAREG